MNTSAPDRLVRDVVDRADRHRRNRAALASLVKAAPVAGAVVFVGALVGRLAGWPAWTTPAFVLGCAGLLTAWFVAARARREQPDVVASRVDHDADLAGELRSAHWFADRSDRDSWADYHVACAADRASAVAWDRLYPPVAAGKPWAATAALTAAAIAVAFVGPVGRAAKPSDLIAAEVAELAEALPPELQARLNQLLAAMDAGDVSADAAKATLEELKALMSQIDPKLQEKLAELAKNMPLGKDAATKRKDLDAEDANERADNAMAGMPEDVKWALEDLAARLANENRNRETAEGNPSASSETGETARGSSQAEATQANAAEAGAQLMRQSASAAEAGASQMMMAGAGAMGGDSSGGAGGNSPNQGGPLDFKSIAQALRQEIIEANTDDLGKDLPKEDIRRKTERGRSALGFTGAAAPTTYDRSRATAPPTVPDARRPLIYNYFIRPR